ncbi:hypothetical protein P344_01315 [Spiroplasma mirum ATCC 29335]|uniref:Uncharacterized protein n=1 Tax=Spiroplasma mirum ATCC 29335 TaxID=838561 RepID=W0GNN3_9MOLU|nr:MULTISPECIES: hypothetical protein [Spiroplasma]AHF60668.1 hypothetical protein SMM_0211 [Spiroplasma mirum ATCC 29335]AHI57628.1 hypothetical protein P344_01315 [Spiroplasma mirum ATCC 29335]
MENLFPSLIDSKYGVVRTRDNSYVIRPFDWNYSFIAITIVQQVIGDAGIPTQWYTEAFKTGLLKNANANDLASNPCQKKVNYKVVGSKFLWKTTNLFKPKYCEPVFKSFID